jgi:glycolate oxidase iron-sulfur subunit
MRAVAERRLAPGDAVRTHLDRCLGCLACETACPAGVEYGRLLEGARQMLSEKGRRPAPIERAVLWGMSGTRGGNSAMVAARLLRALGLARAVGRFAYGRVGVAARLLAATAPAFRAGDRGSAPAPDPPPAAAEGRPSYALLLGCVMKRLFGHVHSATRRTLRSGGYREVSAPGQGCCGALHAHAGDAEAARAMARRNIKAFEAARPDFIAVNSAGCGQAMREYPRWFDTDPEWAARAEETASRVRDVTELLADAPVALRGRLIGRVAYDAPCHLLHGQRVQQAPLRVLGAIDGLEKATIPSSSRCCGGAGIYNLTQPALSTEVLSGKLDEIEKAGVNWVATGNPGCIMQIGSGLAWRRSQTRAVHPVELVDQALP